MQYACKQKSAGGAWDDQVPKLSKQSPKEQQQDDQMTATRSVAGSPELRVILLLEIALSVLHHVTT